MKIRPISLPLILLLVFVTFVVANQPTEENENPKDCGNGLLIEEHTYISSTTINKGDRFAALTSVKNVGTNVGSFLVRYRLEKNNGTLIGDPIDGENIYIILAPNQIAHTSFMHYFNPFQPSVQLKLTVGISKLQPALPCSTAGDFPNNCFWCIAPDGDVAYDNFDLFLVDPVLGVQ